MEEDIKKENAREETYEIERPRRNAPSWGAVIVVAVLAAALVSSVFGFMAGAVAKKVIPLVEKQLGLDALQQPSSEEIQESRQRVVLEDSAVIDSVEKARPAVVSIVISKNVPQMRDFFGDPFGFGFPEFFGPEGSSGGEQQVGGGSGFFISEDGLIVTNKHVVDDMNAEYTVVTNEGKEYSAKVLARDPSQDIAVIKVDGSGFPILELGDSGNVRVGQTVIAIGNSLGEFSNTVSRGIISGLGRNVTAGSEFGGQTERLTNIIQTDAAINPGNSGGPLIDINAKVIGVNVAMAQGAQNIGFALPIDQVKRVAEQVRTTGRISTPFLGIRYVNVDKQLQRENDLPFDYGVLVLRGNRMTDLAVIPGSPADKAGIVENDIVLEVDGEKINEKNQLGDLIARRNVGDTVTLKVWHRGETKDVQVRLEERKG
ncbi:MAG TPA: trypsin-like peptidase domain-containing protein [Candidatus Moranbacteria bacterium]|nr:trypsin-like peptidase domain-containing protein [Candidatus Moranbacteria bacterium]